MSSRTVSVVNQTGTGGFEGDTRDQLLHAAGELMIERGSTEISLSEIAKKSGLNSALVKYYFGNKAGLLMALLRKTLGPSIEQLQHLPAMPLSPKVKLRIHVSGMVNTYFRYPYVNRLMHQMMIEDLAVYGPMIAEEIGKPVANAQREILEEGVRAGLFRKMDPDLFYFHVVGACDQLFYGRYQLKHIFGKEIDEALKRQYIDHLCGVLLQGILIHPDSEGAPSLDTNGIG